MYFSDLKGELEELLVKYLKERDFDLVECLLRYEGRDLVLRVMVDKPQGGITLEECASLNKGIGAMLDEKDVIKNSYLLEICSPGLNRPLLRESDFLRCVSKEVRLFLKEPIEGKLEVEGVIEEVKQGCVGIEVKGVLIHIPLEKIAKGKQKIH